MKTKIEKFLERFPKDATSWAQGTPKAATIFWPTSTG